ncbi:MAG: hypothetical protein PVTTEEND_000576 [Candidatus Fervidibacter sp.]
MPFTVEDLSDLLALLERHPEWKAQLRQVLLTEGLLRLPELVERLTHAVERLAQEAEENRRWRQETDEWRERMVQWQERISAAVERLMQEAEENRRWRQEMDDWRERITQWQERISAAVERLTQEAEENRRWREQMIEWQRQVIAWQEQVIKWQEAVNAWIEDMNQWRKQVDDDLARLKGMEQERFYREKGHAVFGRLLRRGRDASSEVVERLWEAYEKGQISREERHDLSATDVLWLGEFNKVPILLVVEVSFTVSLQDLLRAVRRAVVARKIGYRAVPVIGGAKIPPEVAERARQMDAIVSVNGDFDFDAAEGILQKVAAQ